MRSTIAEEARRCETRPIFAPGHLRPKGGSKIDEATFTPDGEDRHVRQYDLSS